MRVIIFLLILTACIFNVVSVRAQDFRVTYYTSYSHPDFKLKNGKSTLYINPANSYFYHNINETQEIISKTDNYAYIVYADKSGDPVYKNFTVDSMYSEVGVAFLGRIIYQESIPKIKWTLVDSTKTIAKHDCKAAVGVYGERVYFAWYSPSIPISNGPHRLGGLPGLILEATTTDGFVSYSCMSISKDQQPIPSYKEKKLKVFTSIQDCLKKQQSQFKKAQAKMASELDENGYGATIEFDPDYNKSMFIDKTRLWKD